MKLFVLVLSLCLITGIAMASELDSVLSEPNSSATGGANWQHPSFVTNYLGHTHNVIPRENPIGLGLDLEYDINKTLSTALEYKYDNANEEHSVFLVSKIKLNDLIGKK